MLRKRVIPCLLLKGKGLVKTVKFKDEKYVGDPINAVKIFNDKEVDELVFLDITATNEKRPPDFKMLSEISSECFMPLGYGGGITKLQEIEKIFQIGIEKVILNTSSFLNPSLLKDAARVFGNQSIIASVDVKKNWFGKYNVFTNSGKNNTGVDPVDYAKKMEGLGVGEIILNSIDRDGTFSGYDLPLIKKVTSSVNIPVVALGGAASLDDFSMAIMDGGASAVSAGSLFVFQLPHRAVLITYPSQEELDRAINF